MAIEELSHQEDGTGSVSRNSSPREKLGMPAANLMYSKGSPNKLGAELHSFPAANMLKAKLSAPVKNTRAEGRNSFAVKNDFQARSFTIGSGSMGPSERSLTLNEKKVPENRRISVF